MVTATMNGTMTLFLIRKRWFSSQNLKELAEGILKGDRSSLARGVTLGKTDDKHELINSSSVY